ncbi:MAG: hypothetical protein WD824_20080 [Cyclobacteriaceae bacterium]
METETVSIQQMKEALAKRAGSKFPGKITRKDGEVIVRYIRGFADQQTNIVLISETSYSLALQILEVKDIRTLECSSENSDGVWKILHAKWLKKSVML